MGLISSTLGIGVDFVHEGKSYRLSPWTYELQGVYERYLEAEVTEAAKRMAARLPRDEGRILLKDVAKDIGAGLYTFGGEEVARSLDSPKHITKLFHLMLQQDDPSITYDLVKKMIETDLSGIMEKISLANTDPTKGEKTS
jgi:hypothetical protein